MCFGLAIGIQRKIGHSAQHILTDSSLLSDFGLLSLICMTVCKENICLWTWKDFLILWTSFKTLSKRKSQTLWISSQMINLIHTTLVYSTFLHISTPHFHLQCQFRLPKPLTATEYENNMITRLKLHEVPMN